MNLYLFDTLPLDLNLCILFGLQSDYFRDYFWKISLKMRTMESRSEDPMSDPMQSNSAANSVNPPIVFHNTPSFNSQGVSGAVGDWRAPLERERVVNKIYADLLECQCHCVSCLV
ncbi:hypothetical protein HanOQP8_Chr03g0115061 [Helianthus annuus]|nr:hypothetical protein HanOQP8_Chr03g0115061 [Helianthus annuus]